MGFIFHTQNTSVKIIFPKMFHEMIEEGLIPLRRKENNCKTRCECYDFAPFARAEFFVFDLKTMWIH